MDIYFLLLIHISDCTNYSPALVQSTSTISIFPAQPLFISSNTQTFQAAVQPKVLHVVAPSAHPTFSLTRKQSCTQMQIPSPALPWCG